MSTLHRLYWLGILLGGSLFLYVLLFHISGVREGSLSLHFLDVGQGDAIFIESPTGRRVLIDGGPSSAIVGQLDAVLPFGDRRVDLVIATHPDADHVSGLVDVLGRYEVGAVVESDVRAETLPAESLWKTLVKKGVPVYSGRRGDVFDLGGGAILTLLWPDRSLENGETNSASIVAQLQYQQKTYLLTGDAPEWVERYLVRLDGERLKSDVLKAGHHGSKTSTSALFLGYVDPTVAILSRGYKNRYGHPHESVTERLHRFGILVRDICLEGRMTFRL